MLLYVRICRQSSGFVLFTVLIFLQLFVLLSFYSLQQIALTFKMHDVQWTRAQEMHVANRVLRKLEQQLLNNELNCQRPYMASTTLSQQPLSWWQQMTCQGNESGMIYYYFVEFIAHDACAMMSEVNQPQLLIAAYYRITLRMVSAKRQQSNLILQSTVSKPVVTSSSCNATMHHVSAGRQMWREL